MVENLFAVQDYSQPRQATKEIITDEEAKRARILSVNNGYGFIQYPPNNLFFHYQDVEDGEFEELIEGDMVEFVIGINEKGQEVAKRVRKVPDYDVNTW